MMLSLITWLVPIIAIMYPFAKWAIETGNISPYVDGWRWCYFFAGTTIGVGFALGPLVGTSFSYFRLKCETRSLETKSTSIDIVIGNETPSSVPPSPDRSRLIKRLMYQCVVGWIMIIVHFYVLLPARTDSERGQATVASLTNRFMDGETTFFVIQAICTIFLFLAFKWVSTTARLIRTEIGTMNPNYLVQQGMICLPMLFVIILRLVALYNITVLHKASLLLPPWGSL